MILRNIFVSLYYNLIYNMRYGYIYKITSPSGRVYIGKTVDFNDRMSSYRCRLAYNQPLLNKSLKKYGFDNHSIEIIQEGEFEDNELNDLEILKIKEHNSYHFNNKMGMNLTIGGEGVCGLKQKPESIAKMIETRKNNPPTEKELNARAKMWGRKINKSEEWLINSGISIRKPICQYDLSGNLIKEWTGAIEVENTLGFSRKAILCNLKHKTKKSNGFMWRYKNDLSNINLNINRFKGYKRRVINTETHEIFNSIKEAASSIGVRPGCIQTFLSGHIKHKKYPFIYAEQ